jgi:hypothetical protein
LGAEGNTGVIWLIYRAIVWSATLFAVVVLVRLATAAVAAWRPTAPQKPRRDGRWLLGWIVLLLVGWQVIHCEAGGFYGFQDPAGGDWNFDASGWPLIVSHDLFDFGRGGSFLQAICWLAIAVDLVCALLLLAAVRAVLDRLIAAWDGPTRWPALRREALGLCAALAAVLLCERLAARPVMLPGTEIMVYTTLIYESAEVRTGMLVCVASAAYLVGRGVVRGTRTLKQLHEEGVL